MIKSYAKINIFLKIIARNQNGYHQIISRFIKYPKLYDKISFNEKVIKNNNFIINGNFDCKIEQNTIYKAYILLQEYTKSSKLKDFFINHSIDVEKSIPAQAGLGGGSSNCASFLLYINRVLKLTLSQDELCAIGQKIGSDIVFFIKGYNSANVSGTGEIVESFEDEEINLQVFTPNIQCSTKEVFNEYKNSKTNFFKDERIINKLLKQKSKDILIENNPIFLNDLYSPAINLYPKLKKYQKNDNFFSGSGSSIFKISS